MTEKKKKQQALAKLTAQNQQYNLFSILSSIVLNGKNIRSRRHEQEAPFQKISSIFLVVTV
jgi:hypothetical protein